MQIRISTILWLVALTATCAAWMVDRQRWQTERLELTSSTAERDAQLFTGISTFANTQRSCDISFEMDELENTSEHHELIQTQLVADLLDIFRNQTELKICYKSRIYANFDARYLSRDVLKRLGCKTTGQFFEIATSLTEYNDQSHYPELYDLDSTEHKQLEKLVNSAVAVLDHLLPGPYR